MSLEYLDLFLFLDSRVVGNLYAFSASLIFTLILSPSPGIGFFGTTDAAFWFFYPTFVEDNFFFCYVGIQPALAAFMSRERPP